MSTATQLYDVTQGRMCDCFRDPEFRWLRVLDLQSQGDRPEQYDDEWTEAVLNVLQDRATDRRSDDIRQALAIWTDPDGPTRRELEARILTGASDITIATAMDLPPAVVAAYQAIFFDVRPRLTSRDWILLKAIRKSANRDGTKLASHPAQILKSLGYYGGPIILDIALAVINDRPLPPGVISSSGLMTHGEEESLRLSIMRVLQILQPTIPTVVDIADQDAPPAKTVPVMASRVKEVIHE
ncbi:hypothetical protein BH11PLA2_BH11PLA2_50430 [soil metagenome]